MMVRFSHTELFHRGDSCSIRKHMHTERQYIDWQLRLCRCLIWYQGRMTDCWERKSWKCFSVSMFKNRQYIASKSIQTCWHFSQVRTLMMKENLLSQGGRKRCQCGHLHDKWRDLGNRIYTSWFRKSWQHKLKNALCWHSRCLTKHMSILGVHNKENNPNMLFFSVVFKKSRWKIFQNSQTFQCVSTKKYSGQPTTVSHGPERREYT